MELSKVKRQKSNALKYGLGVFAPEIPAGFDVSVFTAADSIHRCIDVPAGEAAGTIRVPASGGVTIEMGPGSSAALVETGAASPRRLDVELVLADGARATYVSLSGTNQAEFVRRRARLAAGASLEWIEACLGPAFSRSSMTTVLEGEGASVRGRSLVFGAGAEQFDLWQEVRHAAPRTTSDLAVRGVLGGSAKAIIRGLIRIEKGAGGCSGHQKEETLLLSEKAEIDAMPNLEIENDDVRCGHAASAGRLDEDKIFYLMSRGLDRSAAERAMIEGFVAPFLQALPNDVLRAELSEKISAGLH